MDAQHAIFGITLIAMMGSVAAVFEKWELAGEIVERIPGRRLTAYAVTLVAAVLLAWPEIQDYQHVAKIESAEIRMDKAEGDVIMAYGQGFGPGGEAAMEQAEEAYRQTQRDLTDAAHE